MRATATLRSSTITICSALKFFFGITKAPFQDILSQCLVQETQVRSLAASGHVAGVINPPARNKRSHWLNDDVEGDAESWFAQAEEKPGSWWPDWDLWMRHHSNGTIPAPTQQGNAQYHPIEPAPGRYVKLKSN